MSAVRCVLGDGGVVGGELTESSLNSLTDGVKYFLKEKHPKCANFLFMYILFKLDRNISNFLEFTPRNYFGKKENFIADIA